jgi:hypothetical protein
MKVMKVMKGIQVIKEIGNWVTGKWGPLSRPAFDV